jgi:GNAT superfamily N-acetyltransferase
MPDVTLRVTRSGDEDFLWSMLFHASHSFEEPDVTPEDVRNNPDLIPYISGWRLGGMTGVIAEGPGPLGAAWLRVLTESDRGNPVYVDDATPELAIAVRPGHEGAGIGSALLERLLADTRVSFPDIVLSARHGNPAVRLYERFGFEVVATMTNRVGTRSVKMVLRRN